MTEYLDLDDLLTAAEAALGRPPRILDLGLLASAVGRPQSSAFGRDAYPSLDEKAAALLHSLARNHGLLDGNKRLAWVATRLLYVKNGMEIQGPVDDAFDLVLEVVLSDLQIRSIAKRLAGWVVRRT